MMLHPAQELEPPEEPARFKQTSAEHHGDDQRQLHHARRQHRYGSAGQRPGRVHFIK
jgi:hypothetical protein